MKLEELEKACLDTYGFKPSDVQFQFVIEVLERLGMKIDKPEEKIEITKSQLERAWDKIIQETGLSISSSGHSFALFLKELGFHE